MQILNFTWVGRNDRSWEILGVSYTNFGEKGRRDHLALKLTNFILLDM